MRGPGLPEDWARDEAVIDWWRGVIALFISDRTIMAMSSGLNNSDWGSGPPGYDIRVAADVTMLGVTKGAMGIDSGATNPGPSGNSACGVDVEGGMVADTADGGA